MDLAQFAFSITPVPCLGVAFSALRLICDTVQQVKTSREQLQTLTLLIAQLLRTLNQEYKTGRFTEARTSRALQNLIRLLDEITAFAHKQASYGLLKSLYVRNDQSNAIESYHRQLAMATESFQISTLINIRDWQQKSEQARAEDQRALDDRLSGLERNQTLLLEALDANHNNMLAMIVSIHRYLEHRSGDDQETRFLSHSLKRMTTSSGRQMDVKNWMITSFDVEFEEKIGCGGFGQIYRGKWNGTQVALKVIKSDGVVPSSTLVIREIDVWSKLTHPHIIQFLGANVFDDNPFIVMSLLPKGNARDYVQTHPKCNRVRLLHDVSLGLVYLHSQNVTHGDVKAMNVLIDDSNKAVLCDFGLSHIKIDITTRTKKGEASFVAGSRFWMSPERLSGKGFRQPSDIYALGMTIFEIYIGETPLAEIPYVNFYALIVKQGMRPERPEPGTKSAVPDNVWNLAEQCWVADPSKRPTSTSIRDALHHMLQLPSPSVAKLQPINIANSSTADLNSPRSLHPVTSRGIEVENSKPRTIRDQVPPENTPAPTERENSRMAELQAQIRNLTNALAESEESRIKQAEELKEVRRDGEANTLAFEQSKKENSTTFERMTTHIKQLTAELESLERAYVTKGTKLQALVVRMNRNQDLFEDQVAKLADRENARVANLEGTVRKLRRALAESEETKKKMMEEQATVKQDTDGISLPQSSTPDSPSSALIDGSKARIERREASPLSDTISKASIMQMVGRLNDDILQFSSYLAGMIPTNSQRKPVSRSSVSDYNNAVAYHTVGDLVGDEVYKLLDMARSAKNPSTALRIAFQACLVSYCAYVILSWDLDKSIEGTFKDLYQELHRTDPSSAARWRVLTRSHLDRLRDKDGIKFASEVTKFISTRLLAIVMILGYPNSLPSALIDEVSAGLHSITRSVVKLKSSTESKMLSSNMEVFSVPSGTVFDAKAMVGEFNDRQGDGDVLVLCTTELGLRCSSFAVKDQETDPDEEILLLPTVILQSAIEMLTS